ncbi:hypothetical protein [Microbacterium thalli]|nr:hypothetical protein [Microbacterium thalli]MDD7930094.1 hypothetical protein [Microbacterium thalli]
MSATAGRFFESLDRDTTVDHVEVLNESTAIVNYYDGERILVRAEEIR